MSGAATSRVAPEMDGGGVSGGAFRFTRHMNSWGMISVFQHVSERVYAYLTSLDCLLQT